MNYAERLAAITSLSFDTEMPIAATNGLELFVLRPSSLSSRFKTYDVNKNFQIWLRSESRAFKPNHLRIFIDVYLRSRSRPDLKERLAQALDNVFLGMDPDHLLREFDGEDFEHFLNSLDITLNLSQLFLIEQDYSYHGESKYEPRTLFYQGWVRQVIDSDKEIDNLLMSIANRQPPAQKYTALNDRNSKKFTDSPPKLWWFGGTT